jgi:hypothetical protein
MPFGIVFLFEHTEIISYCHTEHGRAAGNISVTMQQLFHPHHSEQSNNKKYSLYKGW